MFRRAIDPILPLIAALASTVFAGCSDGGGDKSEDSGLPNDTETGGDTDSDTAVQGWTVEMVEERDVGLQTRLAFGPDGNPAVVYWANDPYEDGICEEIQVNPPPKLRQELSLARRNSSGQGWTVTAVDSPVVAFTPTGIGFAFDSDGRPAVAYTGGEPEQQYCGANDAVLGVLNGQDWAFETAGAMGGESATGEPASDAGFVVGLWPGLAFDSEGEPAIVHKDAHFGSMQHDDRYRADAEFAWKNGGSWSHEAIDYGEGAGDYNALIFDQQGRPVAFYAITVEAKSASRHGVWAARRESDGTWNRLKLHTGAIYQEISAAISRETGEIAVAFYSAGDMAVKLRRLSDSEAFLDSSAWTTETVGDARYDEGRHVSLAFAPSGEIALAYHRCKRVTSTSGGCDQNDEAAVFAIEKDGQWRTETVKKATKGSCGEYTSLGFDGSQNAYVAFRCTEETDQGFAFRLFVANKAIR